MIHSHSILACIRLVTVTLLFSACASFDKTNIQPGQTVRGYGFNFEVPTDTPWFAVEYGTSNRIRLSQLNDLDSYAIEVSLNRGPRRGMYPSAEIHLKAFQRHKRLERKPRGYRETHHEEWVDTRYGPECIRFNTTAIDRAGRNNREPAQVATAGITCAHPHMNNVLVRTEITRRYEPDAPAVNLDELAETLFTSLEYIQVD